jgi:hypothetical protein
MRRSPKMTSATLGAALDAEDALLVDRWRRKLPQCAALNPQFVAWLVGVPLAWTDPTTPIPAAQRARWRRFRRLLQDTRGRSR